MRSGFVTAKLFIKKKLLLKSQIHAVVFPDHCFYFKLEKPQDFFLLKKNKKLVIEENQGGSHLLGSL